MGRPLRAATGGMVYHVLNRANARLPIFDDDGDYEAFFKILGQACERIEMRILAWCLMPNHWHLVLWPHHDGDLSRFLGWLTLTHTQRWHAQRQSAGSGHLYQGAIQVVSHPGRRAFSDGLPLRRAECAAGQPRGAGRGVALGQPARLPAGRRESRVVVSLAHPPFGKLGATRERPPNRGGGRRDPPRNPARTTLRRRPVDPAHGNPIEPRNDAHPPRTAQNERRRGDQRLLTPFIPPRITQCFFRKRPYLVNNPG